MNRNAFLRRAKCGVMMAPLSSALLAVTPVEAFADPPTLQTPTLESTVSLSDLDLSTPFGTRTAHKRLQARAESLCRQLLDGNSASFRWTYAACVKATFADAVQRLNAPTLAASNKARPEP
jgi:UrcA family protein